MPRLRRESARRLHEKVLRATLARMVGRANNAIRQGCWEDDKYIWLREVVTWWTQLDEELKEYIDLQTLMSTIEAVDGEFKAVTRALDKLILENRGNEWTHPT